MTMKKHFRNALAGIMTLAIVTSPLTPAHAIAVFDGANFGQNLLTAVRTLTIINNQIRSLQNEVTMLQNMAKNLQNLNYTALPQLNQAVNQINLLMSQAQGIAFDVAATDAEFAARFPKLYADTVNNDQLVKDARRRWEHSLEGYRNTMRIQAHVSQTISADQSLMTTLVSRSQSAVGALQAQQATNQLIALGVEQTSKTQQLMAAQYRAEAVEQARQVAAEEQARARFKRFAGDGKAYTPLP